jgi:hypothetical protein
MKSNVKNGRKHEKKTLSEPPAVSLDTIVFTTKTGKKYHRDGCRSLSKSKIQTTLGSVYRIYEPCSQCNPPVLKN